MVLFDEATFEGPFQDGLAEALKPYHRLAQCTMIKVNHAEVLINFRSNPMLFFQRWNGNRKRSHAFYAEGWLRCGICLSGDHIGKGWTAHPVEQIGAIQATDRLH